MFLQWSYFLYQFFTVSVSAFWILALDSILAIYSNRGGNYSNTVRWFRQTGPIEKCLVIVRSIRKVPGRISLVLVLTLLAHLLAIAAPVLIGRATEQVKSTSESKDIEMVVSRHYLSSSVERIFMEFSTSIRLEDDPVDILSQLITRTIPNKKGNRKYTPLTSRYTASCTRISLNLIQGEADFLRMSEDSCAPISIHLAGPYLADYPTFTVVPRGEGLYGFSTLIKLNPEFSDLESISSSLVIIHKNESCTVMGNAYNAKDSPISGKLFPPEIKAIKCIYSDGTIDVLSTSYIQFGATSPQSFRSDVGLIMKDHSDLVDAMAENMDVINIHGAPVLLAQYKITDNVADILACYTLIPTNERVMCVYQTINLITMDRQDPDAMISKIREGNRTSGFIPSFYTKMQPIIPIIDGVPEQVSILSLKGSTVKLSNYLASLGQNVDLDWKQMYFIVKYDTQDIIDGFEIPAILFYFCCALMAVSLVMWLITNFWIPEYSGSLHNNITRQLSKRSKTKAPFLMMFSEQTKQFDGVPIISRYPTMVDDADTTVNSLTVALNYMEGVPSDVSLMS